MIFKQETLKSWFTGVGSSINNEVVQPFKNANSIIDKYNLAIQHNSLTQQEWQRLLAQSDDGLKAYLTSIKGTTASMSGYNISLQGNITGFTKITKAMQQYNALGTTSQKEQQAFAAAVSTTNTKLGSYLTGLNGAKASLSGYGLSLIASTAKTIGLTVATTALNATLTMGISLIVSGLISAFVSWIHKSEEITEKAQEAADKINSINDSLKSNTETVENAKKRYAELAQEVENLGKITQSQGTLSNEEYEEFLDLSNQLAGIFPSLTKNYDDNGNAILDLSGDVNTIVGSLDSLIQKEKELANQKIMEEFPDVFKGWNQDLSNAEQKVKSAKTEFDKINNAYQQLSKGSASQAFDLQGNGWFTNENGEKITVSIAEYEQALKDLGIEYEKTNIMVKNQFGGDTLSGYLIEATGDIDMAFTSKLEKAREDLQYAQQQLEGQTSSINQYLNTWLQTEFSYNQIEDSGLQQAIQDVLFNFDWNSLPEDIDKNNWNAVSEYLRRNILFSINNIDDSKVSKALSDIYSGALTSGELLEAISKVQEYFGDEHPISISLQSKVDDTQPLINNVKEKLQDEFDDKAGELTLKDLEIAANLDIPEGTLLSWDELIAKIEEVKEQQAELANQPLSISDTIDQLNTRLKPAMDSLKSSYQDIFDDDGKFQSDSIDILSTCDSIKSKLDELNKIEGITVDYSSYEDFVKVLRDSKSTEQDVEKAFDSLSTAITHAAISGTEDFETMKAALDGLGVVNSSMIAFDELTSNMDLFAEKAQQAGLSMDKFVDHNNDGTYSASEAAKAFIEEMVGADNCAQALALLQLKQTLINQSTITTADDCQNILDLATAAGVGIVKLQQLQTLMDMITRRDSAVASGDSRAVSELNRAIREFSDNVINNLKLEDLEIDFDGFMGGSKSASKAGSKAADAYLEAFEKELKDLQTLRDQGVISEAEYLRRLRALYSRYFKDRKEYLDEFKKYEREYLEGRHTCPLLQ